MVGRLRCINLVDGMGLVKRADEIDFGKMTEVKLLQNGKKTERNVK